VSLVLVVALAKGPAAMISAVLLGAAVYFLVQCIYSGYGNGH